MNKSQRGIKVVKANTTPGRWDFISKPPFRGCHSSALALDRPGDDSLLDHSAPGNGVCKIDMSAQKLVRKFFLCTGECVRADQLRDYPGSHIIGELHYVLDEGQRLTAWRV